MFVGRVVLGTKSMRVGRECYGLEKVAKVAWRRDYVRLWDGTETKYNQEGEMGGGFGQRTIWVVTEEIPVASAVQCVWPLTSAPKAINLAQS